MNYNIEHILKENDLILAPMAGITDLAFREIVREQSKNLILCISEMISAKALTYKDKRTFELLKTSELDNPLSIQLFGHEVEILSEATKIITDLGFKMIDFNCGCPAPKIVKNGDGSALMLEPNLIFDIVSTMKKVTDIPISVKMRIGYDWDTITVLEVAKLCQEAGADFVTIHGRTRNMGYGGQADYSYIKLVKDALKIPVIGNGDVINLQTYEKIKNETGCDGVMIGRAALGNPFFFKKFTENKVEKEEKLKIMEKHIEKMCAYKINGIKEARCHIMWYLKGLSNAKRYKVLAGKVKTMADVKSLINSVRHDDSIV